MIKKRRFRIFANTMFKDVSTDNLITLTESVAAFSVIFVCLLGSCRVLVHILDKFRD